MQYGELFQILELSGLSPEQAAPLFGLSHMTLRRWMKMPPRQLIAKSHEPAIAEGIYQLIIDGKLDTHSSLITRFLQDCTSLSFEAAIHSLQMDDLKAIDAHPGSEEQNHKVVRLLYKIGQNPDSREDVQKVLPEIKKFSRFGQDWKEKLNLLLKVVRSRSFSTTEKLVAYGALIYLISPIDLIPDHIPVIGYVDDFAFISIAVSYYLSHFKKLEGPLS